MFDVESINVVWFLAFLLTSPITSSRRIIKDVTVSGHKAVASLSLAGGPSVALNAACASAHAAGVLVVVAAGNAAKDACGM